MTDLAYSLLLLMGTFVVVVADDRKLRRRLRQILIALRSRQ
jgi:hypothetical protein